MLEKLYKKLTRQKWVIGFVNNPLQDIVSGTELNIQWMKHKYVDRWFADPFILDVTESQIILLVEELKYSDNKGVISKITVDRDSCSLVDRRTILELPTHLSFPAIIRDGDKIYIYPESSATGKLLLYEYDIQTDECGEKEVLCTEPLTDAIIYKKNDDAFLFSTKMPNPNANVLSVYKLGNNGVYKKIEGYTFSENIARNAGDFFEIGNSVYRPAQECNNKYGHSISIQKIDFKSDKIDIKEIVRIPCPSPKYTEGFHTLNTYKGVTVIDVRGFVNYRIGKCLFRLKNRI